MGDVETSTLQLKKLEKLLSIFFLMFIIVGFFKAFIRQNQTRCNGARGGRENGGLHAAGAHICMEQQLSQVSYMPPPVENCFACRKFLTSDCSRWQTVVLCGGGGGGGGGVMHAVAAQRKWLVLRRTSAWFRFRVTHTHTHISVTLGVGVCNADMWVMCLLIGSLVPLTLEQTSTSPGDQSCYIIVLLTARGMFVFTAGLVQPSGGLT